MSYLPPVNATTTPTDGSGTTTPTGSRSLSQNDFLNLLVAQMKSQDPLNPQSDTQMAAQMAQFTSLQQSSTMSANIATMLTQQQILQANSMLGGTVSIQVDAKTTDSGVVQAVEFNGGSPKIVVKNKSYDLSQVLMLSPTAVGPASSPTPPEATPALPSDRGYAAP